MPKAFTILALIVATSLNAVAAPSKEAACGAFQDADSKSQSAGERLKLALTAINSSYKTGYSPVQLTELSNRGKARIAAAGTKKLEALEETALVGCGAEMSDEDRDEVKQALDNLQ